MPEFLLSNRLTIKQKRKAISIIKSGAKENLSKSEIIDNLKKENITYRKQNMLRDIRYAESYSKAKSPEARERAKTWWKNIHERLRKKYKTQSNKINKIIQCTKTQSYENLTKTELNEALLIRKEYKDRYGYDYGIK